MTLVELLVAMLIFISIMGGVAILFSNASSTVAQADMAMEGYERARSSLARLERDMSAGFTARELGDTYQFYGQPNGLCFVGALENAQIGRVTYVIRPKGSFVTQIGEMASDLFTRAVNRDLATGMTVNDPTRSAACALNLYCVETGRIDATTGDLWLAWIGESFMAGGVAPLPSAMANGVAVADAVIELPVRIDTAALARFEESTARDLVSFKLPGEGALAWPVISTDWENSDNDSPPLYPEDPAYCEMHKALLRGGSNLVCPINPTDGDDLRKLIDDSLADSSSDKPRILGPSVIQRIIRAKHGELWLRLVAQDSNDWFARECYRFVDPATPGGLDILRVPEDYEMVDHILMGAFIAEGLSPGTAGLDGFDVLGVPSYFSYTNGDYANKTPIVKPTFNTLANIPGYTQFVSGLGDPALAARDFDDALDTAVSAGWTTGQDVGSPLDSRLPYSIQVGFWIVIESRAPTVADFRRWFTQVIEIPCAFTRKG